MGIYDRDYERSYDTGSGWRDSYSGGDGGGFATWTANSKLLVVLVGVYVAQVMVAGFSELFVLQADWPREPWRIYGLLTYPLLHSERNLQHLLFNGLALFFFGRSIEERLGSREYLTFFFATAAFAGAAWTAAEWFTHDLGNHAPVLLGASGGIAGILVLFALWYPNVQIYLMGILPVPAWVMAILFLAQDINGALHRTDNVAYTAHLGGALFGFLYFRGGFRLSSWLPGGGFSLGDLFKRKPNLRVHRVEDDDSPEVDAREDEVDEILRKIQQHGQDSLTSREKRILERASRRYKAKRK